jgi:hypothetical protein
VTGSGASVGPAAGGADQMRDLVNASLGAISLITRPTRRTARFTLQVVRPVVGRASRIAVVEHRWRPLAESLRRRGEPISHQLAGGVAAVVDLAVPLLVEHLLRRVDVTEVVRRHVDLDRLVADVDLDGVALQLDVNAVATRLDVDAVAARLDLELVLDRVDLTALVLGRLDLTALVSAVLDHVDLVSLAEEVIEAVDLPEIIRDSTGAMTSDTLRGARLRSATADQAVRRLRDRLLVHHHDMPSPVRTDTAPGTQEATVAVASPRRTGHE